MSSIITVEHLERRFGDVRALRGISFDVHHGEVFGYLGPNGAGKTTTVRILNGLVRPTAGRAEVMGRDVGERSSDVRGRIGVVLEEPGLYDRLSACDNLQYYARIHRIPRGNADTKVRRLLEFAGLWLKRNVKVGTFSKGMKQRLALARALLHDPELLFFDEPTAGLDPEGRSDVRDLILELARDGGRTIFLNSHDLAEVDRVCTRIAILRSGEIVACDDPAALRRSFSACEVEVVLESRLDEMARSALSRELIASGIAKGCRWSAAKLVVELNGNDRPAALIDFLVGRHVGVEEVRRITKSLEEVYLSLIKEGEG